MPANCPSTPRADPFRNVHQTGVTLVELIVTIIVLAILASLALPAFQSSIEKRRLIEAGEAVFSQVQFARSESLKQSREMLLDTRTDGGTTWCIGISENATAGCTCSTAGSCTITLGTTGGVEKNLSSGSFSNIRMTNGTFELIFNRLHGTATNSTPGTPDVIELRSPGNLALNIVVSPLGQIRICSPAGSGNVGGYPTC